MTKFHNLAETLVPKLAAVTDDEMAILRFAYEAPHSVVLVTLVEVRGGAARAVGAQMAVREDGLFCGYISGGCTEGAVAAEALATLGQGSDRFLKLGEGSPFFDIVLPCGGGLTLSLHVLKDRRAVGEVIQGVEARQTAALAYDPKLQRLSVSTLERTGWDGELFHRAYRPRHRLALGGTGIEAETTRQIARAAGYDVVPIDSENMDENTSVVILLHDLDRELPLLETALSGRSRYIGALGSKRTHERRCEALRQRGHSEQAISRIRGPIGLFGPARDASTMALSIMADIAR